MPNLQNLQTLKDKEDQNYEENRNKVGFARVFMDILDIIRQEILHEKASIFTVKVTSMKIASKDNHRRENKR